MIHRRAFLTGLLAAPIIVRPGLLMPVRPLAAAFDAQASFNRFLDMANARMREQINQSVIEALIHGRSYVVVSYHGAARVDALPS